MPQQEYSGEYQELYVGDTVLFGNLTLQAGLRWDNQQSQILPMDVAGNAILGTPLLLPCTSPAACGGNATLNATLPGISYPGQDEALEWSSISPRIGMTYALGQAKQTILRASYNRYVSQMGSTVASSSPVGNSYMEILSVDANGDKVIQRGELGTIRRIVGLDPNNPSSLTSVRRIDYDMNPPTTDEFSIGADHELFPDLVIGMTYTHRINSDQVAVLYEKTQGRGDWYTSADYVPAGFNAGGMFVQCPLGYGATAAGGCNGNTAATSGTTTSPLTSFQTGTTPVYRLAPGLAAPQFSVITNRPDYEQTFDGIELTATKRLADNWMMRFNAAYNDYSDDCGDDSFANPTVGLPATGLVNGSSPFAGPAACPGGQVAPQSAGSGAFGNVFINSRWNFNLNGAYIFPWDINLGANIMARQGYPGVQRANITGLPGGTVGVVLDPVGDIRFDNVYQLDLRLAKDFRIMSRLGLTLSADVFNATNERTILQRNTILMQHGAAATSANSVSNGHRITELQAPRVWRFGAKITY